MEMEKIKIQGSANPDSPDGSHLQPVIDFLIQQGNIPHTRETKFERDKGGIGKLNFFGPIDHKAILQKFEFPDTIVVGYDEYYAGGVVWDKGNALIIHRAR